MGSPNRIVQSCIKENVALSLASWMTKYYPEPYIDILLEIVPHMNSFSRYAQSERLAFVHSPWYIFRNPKIDGIY